MKTLKTKLTLLLSALALIIALAAPSSVLADCKSTATPQKSGATSKELNECLKENPITKRLNQVIAFLSAGVGIVVTGVIILGGIQYILAGDNAAAITAARQRIINGLLALFVFLFIYAFLQWLVPGGVFG
jgi:hypothetical protein